MVCVGLFNNDVIHKDFDRGRASSAEYTTCVEFNLTDIPDVISNMPATNDCPANRNRSSKSKNVTPRKRCTGRLNSSPIKWSFVLKSVASSSSSKQSSAPKTPAGAMLPVVPSSMQKYCRRTARQKAMMMISPKCRQAAYMSTPCTTKMPSSKQCHQLDAKHTSRTSAIMSRTRVSKADRLGSISSNNNVRLSIESHADTRRSRRLFSSRELTDCHLRRSYQNLIPSQSQSHCTERLLILQNSHHSILQRGDTYCQFSHHL